jgi:hypothetical protein
VRETPLSSDAVVSRNGQLLWHASQQRRWDH